MGGSLGALQGRQGHCDGGLRREGPAREGVQREAGWGELDELDGVESREGMADKGSQSSNESAITDRGKDSDNSLKISLVHFQSLRCAERRYSLQVPFLLRRTKLSKEHIIVRAKQESSQVSMLLESFIRAVIWV